MDLGKAGLREQPFGPHGRPLAVVPYGSYKAALSALRDTLTAPYGVVLLQGPSLSGKSTVLSAFTSSLDDEQAIATVDGDGLNAATLLEAMLSQFGYEVDFTSAGELFAMVRVFVLEQAARHSAPILVIENTLGMNPSALRALCELATLKVRRGNIVSSAIKVVLASDRSLASLMASPAMEAFTKRRIESFHLQPLTREETVHYLHTKLRAAGSEIPDFVLSRAVCGALWEASDGWPGMLDRVALLALAKAETLPVSADDVEQPAIPVGTETATHEASQPPDATGKPGLPTLFVSHGGRLVKELVFDSSRILIGRSEHNDIPIPSRFVSRHHALLVRNGGSTLLMDLNSTNGTFVNSKRVSNQVLRHDDVITIGHHRIKFSDPEATSRGALQGAEFADTVIMKTLDDMRRLLAEENTALLPAASEKPTQGAD